MATTRKPPFELIEQAAEDPDAIDHDTIAELLDHDRLEWRTTGLRVLTVFVLVDSKRVLPFVDDVIDALDDRYGLARSQAALVLAELAEDRPALVEPAIPRLVELLDDPTPKFRYRPARAVGTLSMYYPETLAEYTDRFVEALVDGPGDPIPDPPDDPNQRESYQKMVEYRKKDYARFAGTREVLANVLVEVARIEPEDVADHLPAILDTIDEEVPHVRGGIIDVVRVLAQHDPALVDAAIEPLIERLDDDAAFIRARAIRALGFAEATEAIEPIRELAENDREEAVQEFAAETAEWLEANA